ncbi:MAG: hypothetical protein ABSA74_00420 [Candidatus Staskawiczbacteria bacterium]|jgi:hypothetical protein
MATWLDVLRDELAKLDPASFAEPRGGVEDGETVVGVVGEEFRRIHELATNYERMAAEKAIQGRYARDDESREFNGELACKFAKKSNMLYEIFWISVKDELDLWDKPALGVRKGWNIVWFSPPRRPHLEILGCFPPPEPEED